ncbi:serine dehydratase [Lewinellaceae bacterium SD302]|nr:serine dehydratase [Lewinellaceae bacterium SD302]
MLPKIASVPTRQELLDTQIAIQPLIHRTPVLRCTALEEMVGAELYFKCENFQKVGAFKMRGGASAALRLNTNEMAKGLATHSSGNHAQAVARAAQYLEVPAYIVMPEDAPKVKVKAVKGYGAEIFYCVNTPEDRLAALEKLVAKTGAHFIHPFDDWHVIAGQASCAMELIEQAEAPLDYVIPPVGGGGLTSGTALACHYFSPATKVWGAEPENVDDAYRALKSGKIEINLDNRTVADGLRTNLGDRTFQIISQHVPRILLVSESEIITAMRLIWERMKIVIEPSCAVPFAAALRYREEFAGKKVGLILTGGNVDLGKLPF